MNVDAVLLAGLAAADIAVLAFWRRWRARKIRIERMHRSLRFVFERLG